jgi:hypothetical protein
MVSSQVEVKNTKKNQLCKALLPMNELYRGPTDVLIGKSLTFHFEIAEILRALTQGASKAI